MQVGDTANLFEVLLAFGAVSRTGHHHFGWWTVFVHDARVEGLHFQALLAERRSFDLRVGTISRSFLICGTKSLFKLLVLVLLPNFIEIRFLNLNLHFWVTSQSERSIGLLAL